MTKDLFCGLPGKKRRSECDCSLQTAKIKKKKKKRLSCSHRPTLRTAWLSSSSCSPQATLETSRLHPFSECSILNQGVTLLLDSLTLNLSVSHQQTLPKAILQTLVRSQRAATLGRRVKRVEGFKTMQSFGTQRTWWPNSTECAWFSTRRYCTHFTSLHCHLCTGVNLHYTGEKPALGRGVTILADLYVHLQKDIERTVRALLPKQPAPLFTSRPTLHWTARQVRHLHELAHITTAGRSFTERFLTTLSVDVATRSHVGYQVLSI